MPRELPGLWWDEQRNRYFPLSAKPALVSSASAANTQTPGIAAVAGSAATPRHTTNRIDLSRRDRRLRADSSFWGIESLKRARDASQRERIRRQIQASQICQTSRVTRTVLPLPDNVPLASFETTKRGSRTWSFAGDSLGWFYSSNASDEDDVSTAFSNDWKAEFNLMSEVSSICTDQDLCIATAFGRESKILLFPLRETFVGITVLKISARYVHDIRASSLRGENLVLGASGQALLVSNVGTSHTYTSLQTGSDVFSLLQDENVVYTGARNGNILRFDTRIEGSKPDDLFRKTGRHGGLTSITSLNRVREWQLLVGQIDGRLGTFDLRFVRSNHPLLTYTGNVNSYAITAPVTVDPHEDFLFAAGQDRRVRIWSVSTGGKPLNDGMPPSMDSLRLFQRVYRHPICALKAVAGDGGTGTSLYVASGSDLCEYNLGECVGPRVF
ncbi:hypothetical protein CONPUDRAFT_82017 [Coniophora puteana RWD-64-598 SS2]|uniref:WD40 repeat-like protein n=1 Tax=Coniophora puteana (strain RWD-64-598) TaxID=741705 RepID=A0A5M3MPB8_CONPW|nr:uncharacterized protein CONPUDRAFT_82017 [Coniophora puteana RWD-64-598 SS2]EIW80886.1 hypothetical protein CONPUDRAFT_82017 [Coniophora puteana RWD-64-598 SS2]